MKRSPVWLLLTVFSLLPSGAWAADEPPPAPPAAPAPTAAPPSVPAGAVAVLVANAGSGFTKPLEKKEVQGLFRGILQQTPNKHRVIVYLLPAASPAQVAFLQEALGMNESQFERSSQMLESSLGRIYFKRLANAEEVLQSVQRDPGAVGVLPPETLLAPGMVVLWPAASP